MPATQRALAALLALTLAGPAPAVLAAGMSQPQNSVLQTDEVTLRLVAGAPDAQGTVRGALVVELAPGWKTYWIDPGDAGIPPSIDFSATEGAPTVELAFPAPHRFGAEPVRSNGYTAPMAIAFTLEGLGSTVPITASVMLGICETICIPVSASLSVAPSASPEAEAAVEAAFAALPQTSAGRIASAVFHPETEAIAVETEAGGEASDLFLAGPAGWYFGAPTIQEGTGGTVTFTVPVLDRPRQSEGPPTSVDAILTTGGQAFERRGIMVVAAVRR